jgi:hypothetical protein
MTAKMEAPAVRELATSGLMSCSGDTPEAISTETELQELRALWWRLACQGMRLSAKRNVIIVEGGGR